MQLPEGKSRLDLVREGLAGLGLSKRGRLVVSLDRLREDPHNERRAFHHMDGLTDSVREHGIIEPITVTPDGDHYRILTGHRRFRAALAAGLTEVEILIREPEDESQRRIKSLISNIQRENLSAIDLAEALQSILAEDATIGTNAELGRRIGKSRQWVGEMLGVLTLPPNLQQKVRSSEHPVAYDAIMKIAHLNDPVEQSALLDAALRGESASLIREKARTIRERSGDAKARPRRTERLQETMNGYTAVVSGPASPEANRHMRAVVEALLERLDTGLN